MNTYRPIPFEAVDITGGLWQEKQNINRDVTLQAVRDRFSETGRFEALKCGWREGMPNKPHIFWDSDVAKWMEAAAFLVQKQPMPEMEPFVEGLIDELERHQLPDGYLNSYFVGVEPARRWQDRSAHELYCAGHLMEAAVAWYKATGRDRFLRVMCRCADHIDEVFRVRRAAAFATPGHSEIELALLKLYEATGEERYLRLSRWFVDQRGQNDLDEDLGENMNRYRQNHLPCAQQTTAEGHAVRACYLYAAMADLARLCDDARLASASRAIFDNITQRRMYITGGLGSNHLGEAFSLDYFLPGPGAYTETCAGIAFIYFAQRLLLLEPDSRYADAIERVLFNGFLSSWSQDGKRFFYTNPIEVDVESRRSNRAWMKNDWMPLSQRAEGFGCSCCPPNINRFVASVGECLCTASDGCVYVHQYLSARAEVDGGALCVETDYPRTGTVRVRAQGLKQKEIALRIPAWCSHFTLNAPYEMRGGYAVAALTRDAELLLEMDMPPMLVQADARVHDAWGKAAVMRGPVVYCAEGLDQEESVFALALKGDGAIRLRGDEGFGLPVLEADACRRPKQEGALYTPYRKGWEEAKLVLIPYYAFANRGETDMRIWMPVC